jgi:hypothetical protein
MFLPGDQHGPDPPGLFDHPFPRLTRSPGKRTTPRKVSGHASALAAVFTKSRLGAETLTNLGPRPTSPPRDFLLVLRNNRLLYSSRPEVRMTFPGFAIQPLCDTPAWLTIEIEGIS